MTCRFGSTWPNVTTTWVSSCASKGMPNEAVASFRQARSINEALAKAFPDKPRYRDILAKNLVNLGLALRSRRSDQGRGNLQRRPGDLREAGRGLSRKCRLSIGTSPLPCGTWVPSVAAADKPDQAEAIYKEALAKLETKDAKDQSPEGLRVQAELLNNLAELDLPGAEDAYRRSIALSQSLVDGKPSLSTDRHILAIAQHNLAKFLLDGKRLGEAGPFFAQSVANFEKLVAQAPKAIDFQSHFGIVLATQGKWLDSSDKTPRGQDSAHERRRAPATRPFSSARTAPLIASCSVAI